MTGSEHLVEIVSSSYQDGCHKAAIALNNTAVGLLIRGFYQDALDTIKDATKPIMCAAVSEKEQTDQEKTPWMRLFAFHSTSLAASGMSKRESL